MTEFEQDVYHDMSDPLIRVTKTIGDLTNGMNQGKLSKEAITLTILDIEADVRSLVNELDDQHWQTLVSEIERMASLLTRLHGGHLLAGLNAIIGGRTMRNLFNRDE